jgi:hypothetical protein
MLVRVSMGNYNTHPPVVQTSKKLMNSCCTKRHPLHQLDIHIFVIVAWNFPETLLNLIEVLEPLLANKKTTLPLAINQSI